MIDTRNLNVGDTFYSVKERNNVLNRSKISKVIDGEEWFKYDNPIRSYEIVPYTIMGILRKELEGKWPQDERYALETEFSVICGKNEHNFYTTDLEYEVNENYFFTIEEAEDHKSHLEELAKEMDRT